MIAAESQLRLFNPATCALGVLAELLVVQMSGRLLASLCTFVMPADGMIRRHGIFKEN
jgi:hypothetical protein